MRCAENECPDGCGGRGFCYQDACVCFTGFEGAACEKCEFDFWICSVWRDPCCVRDAVCTVPPELIKVVYVLRCILCVPADRAAGSNRISHNACASLFAVVGDPTCPKACSARGVCQHGRCFCVQGYKGDDCSEDGAT